MLRKICWLFIVLFTCPIFTLLVYADNQTFFGPKSYEIGKWYSHSSIHIFHVANPGKGVVTISKNRPDKPISGGFIILNATFIPLQDFLTGQDVLFKKEITLLSHNVITVFLRGNPGAPVTITIDSGGTPVQPPEISFSADPPVISLGESSTLSWHVIDAGNIRIAPGIESASPNGFFKVFPNETTTYILTAVGPGGTTIKSVTVSVKIPLPIVTLQAEPATISLGESATLIWSSALATAAVLDSGIGPVPVNGSITVTPTRNTAYTITVTGPGGTASAGTSIAVSPALSIRILSPINGNTIDRSEIAVWGNLSDASGLETGIVVNGIVALVDGNQFVADRVPLLTGENTLTARAVNAAGRSAKATVRIFAHAAVPSIRISAVPQSGLAPFETSVTIAAPMSLEEMSVRIDVDGPENAVVTKTATDTYTLGMNTPGFYTVSVVGEDGQKTAYADTIVVQVLDRRVLDTLLHAKWETMKTRLASGDVARAVALFSDGTKPMFEYNFNLLQDHLTEMVAGLQSATLVRATDDLAEYNLIGVQAGHSYSFYLVFEKGADGLWRIKFF